MQFEKPPFCIFSIHILNRETFTFLSLIVFSILDDTNLLPAFPFGNKDGTASGLSIYCKLPPRRHRFSSWLSSNESLVKWSEDPRIALGKTGLAIALIQAPHIFSLVTWYFMIWNIFVQSWLIWTTFHCTHQVTIFVSSKYLLALCHNICGTIEVFKWIILLFIS